VDDKECMKKRPLSYVPLLILSLLCSCSENSSSGARTSLGIRTPQVSSIEAITPAVSATTPYVNSGLWGLTTPVSLSEIDCFGIAVSYPEDTGNSCHLLSGGAIDIDEMFGSVASGELLQADISSGLNRNIQVIGFATSDGSCPKDIRSLSKEQMANSSAPVVLGEKLADVEGETMEVEIVISMTNPIAVNDCSGENYTWEEGSPKSNNFSIENGYLTVSGSNLGSVRSATLRDRNGLETKLSVESRNNNGVALKALSALNLAMHSVYDLLISNAYGQEVFNISVGGSSGYKVKTISSNYSILSEDNQSLILVNNKSNVNLPSAASVGAGFNLVIKNIGSGDQDITMIEAQTGEYIDKDNSAMILASTLATINLTSDGVNWWMLSSNGTLKYVKEFGSCSLSNCYSNTDAMDKGWAKITETGDIMNYGYDMDSGYSDLWGTIKNNGYDSFGKILIKPGNNSSSYLITTNAWIADNYDQHIMGEVSGEHYGKMPQNSMASLSGSFYDQVSSTNLYEHDGTSDIQGYLNGLDLSNVNNYAYDRLCAHTNGRMISQSDTGIPPTGDGLTYWTADASLSGVNYYQTWDGDSGLFSGTGEPGTNSHYIMCIWPDIETSFGLE